jgi:hypothetical protein
MATAEHTSSSSSLPFRQRRPAGCATVMAATFLALLAAFGRSPVAMAAADSSPEFIELTLLTGAQEKGAGLC